MYIYVYIYIYIYTTQRLKMHVAKQQPRNFKIASRTSGIALSKSATRKT